MMTKRFSLISSVIPLPSLSWPSWSPRKNSTTKWPMILVVSRASRTSFWGAALMASPTGGQVLLWRLAGRLASESPRASPASATERADSMARRDSTARLRLVATTTSAREMNAATSTETITTIIAAPRSSRRPFETVALRMGSSFPSLRLVPQRSLGPMHERAHLAHRRVVPHDREDDRDEPARPGDPDGLDVRAELHLRGRGPDGVRRPPLEHE